MARHLHQEAGGDPSQGPVRELANEPPSPSADNDFPDVPDANADGHDGENADGDGEDAGEAHRDE